MPESIHCRYAGPVLLLLACAEEPVPEPPWGDGDRAVSGNAFFFTMDGFPNIVQVTDVVGAQVYVLEAPELRHDLVPDDEHAFRLEGIPRGVDVTLALVHDDYYPHLTATHRVQDRDLELVNFQAVSHEVVEMSAGLFGVDVYDDELCHMATTVTAISDNQDLWWAVGEPGATVTIDPPVDPDEGPIYFNELVLPDLTLTETSTDGGVAVFGADPGTYRWEAHKDGVEINGLTMTCVGGWVTNGAPPWGMQVQP